MPKNWCFWIMVLEKTLESPLDCKKIKPGNPKGNQSNTLTTWCEELTHWERLWCWEGLGAGGKGDNRGWDGWMASLTWWTWVWVDSGSWWWTGRPGVLRFMGPQRVGHNWATELNWTEHHERVYPYSDLMGLNPKGFNCVALIPFCVISNAVSFLWQRKPVSLGHVSFSMSDSTMGPSQWIQISDWDDHQKGKIHGIYIYVNSTFLII